MGQREHSYWKKVTVDHGYFECVLKAYAPHKKQPIVPTSFQLTKKANENQGSQCEPFKILHYGYRAIVPTGKTGYLCIFALKYNSMRLTLQKCI